MRIARASFIAVALLTMLMSLAACNSKDEKLRHEPVVVYASAEDEAVLPKWFADFSEETDIPVTVSYAEPVVQSRSVIENTGSPPADILLTNNIADVWRAADLGALRPIQAAALEAVPSTLKDPDGFWVALDYRRAVIAVGAKAGLDRPQTYADLAAPAYRGHICLASSVNSVNRSVIAMLIADIGARPTELIVRGWVKNFALPPFDTQKKLLAALKSGSCDYGIVSSKASKTIRRRFNPKSPTSTLMESALHVTPATPNPRNVWLHGCCPKKPLRSHLMFRGSTSVSQVGATRMRSCFPSALGTANASTTIIDSAGCDSSKSKIMGRQSPQSVHQPAAGEERTMCERAYPQ